MSKPSILFISDRPERFSALRASALAGRTVHLWMPDEGQPPPWSTHVRGDPTRPATYAHLADGNLLAIVDLADEARATRAARGICKALPASEVVVLARQRGRRHTSTRDRITWIDEGELLADAILSVLRKAQARKRLRSLRRALRGAGHCTFLVQNDPDPDAIAASLALRAALGFTPDKSPIVSCGRVTRPENRRLIDALAIRIQHVSNQSLTERRPLVLVDVQPSYFSEDLGEVAAVIDHHPPSGRYRTRHRDVRTSYGASATMAGEYLIAADEQKIDARLATALLYGIITDTKSLSRHTSDEDLQMFARIFPLADHAALRRITHPSYAPLPLRRLGAALQTVTVVDGVAYLHLGTLPRSEEHVVAQFAEFCLGIAGAEVSAVSGVFGTQLVMSTRALSPEARLGERLRAAFGRHGSAGGHAIMAKAVVQLSSWRAEHPFDDEQELAKHIGAALRQALASKTMGTVYEGEGDRERSASDLEQERGAIGSTAHTESADSR
ncbi:MAG TPA: hypothetical protein VMM77_12745 [Gemmatimonadaceae bacterium]|nr:hypothetical protein [Gemmatimonadaceae bacterium]